MKLTLRNETPNDYRAVEELLRDAFWDVYAPGCTEHFVAHRLRASASFVPQLDFVALQGGRIIGSILYSRAQVTGPQGSDEILTFGPLGVLPALQGQGVGSALIRHTLPLAAALHYRAVIIYGNPAYYGRFGFRNAAQFGITTADGANFDAFMALELTPGALAGISGHFLEDAAFEPDDAAFLQYDAAFPPREKHVTDTQLR